MGNAHYFMMVMLVTMISLTSVSSGALDTGSGLDYKLSLCVDGYRNQVLEALGSFFKCVRSSFYRCLEFHQPQHENRIELHLICGVINSGFDMKPTQWTIKVCSPLHISIRMLHFHIAHLKECKNAYVIFWLKDPIFRLWHHSSLHLHLQKLMYSTMNGLLTIMATTL